MSQQHLDNTKITNISDNYAQEERDEFHTYQIKNMYDVEKNVNPLDIAGQPGIVKAQMIEFEKKKVLYRMSNEVYLKQHPELHIMISIFLFRILEEKPEDLLQYAGRFFNQANLKEVL